MTGSEINNKKKILCALVKSGTRSHKETTKRQKLNLKLQIYPSLSNSSSNTQCCNNSQSSNYNSQCFRPRSQSYCHHNFLPYSPSSPHFCHN